MSGQQGPNTFKMAAPSGYVAGAGRGAMGFTTRSDIGPARPSLPTAAEPNFGPAPAGYVAGRGRGMGELAREQGEMFGKPAETAPAETEVDAADYSVFDKFSGYTERLFAQGTPYEDDDVEADKIYEGVDEFMNGRHKRRHEKNLIEEQKKRKTERPKIADQFADLKRELATVSYADWDAIPDVGDHSLRYKQNSNKNKDALSVVPDFLIADKAAKGRLLNSIDVGNESVHSGFQSTTGLSEARGTVLQSKLDKISDSVSGQTVVDPKGYLTNLNSINVMSDDTIGDIKKARALLHSVTTTNPKHGPGWIAAARLEYEKAGDVVTARKIIREGCEICPDSEDVWLEAAHLHTPENAKVILANAVKKIPTSVNLWLEAASLETSNDHKKVVLRRALEIIPNSVKLWKMAIQLENVADARIMLARAVECVPHSIEMWLALAKLESYENARKVLNNAREANPTEHATWITAAKLEEAHGNGHVAARIIEKMMASLNQYSVVMSRETCIHEAEEAEAAGSVATCKAIINNSIHIGVDDEDRIGTWMDDAETCLSKTPPFKDTARAIYEHALSIFPNKKILWMAAASLEKSHGTTETLENMLKRAVTNCPQAEVLWLMAAKEKWLHGNVAQARAILVEAFEAIPNNIQIMLAAVKLEWENNEYQRARVLLSKARDRASTEQVWMKSALLELEVNEVSTALELLDKAITLYPAFAKYYMMAGQACDGVLNDQTRARDYYQKGLKVGPLSVPLWKLIIRLEEKSKGCNKARSMMELARLKLPENEELYLEAIRLERRAGNEKLAESLMAQALQICPKSGILWAEEILTCPKPSQKSKSVDALKKCDNDPFVVTAVARLFAADNKGPKARKWFERAVTLEPKLGDAWAYYYAYELKQLVTNNNNNGNDLAEDVLQKCILAEPNRGELWCNLAKKTENRRLNHEAVLKKLTKIILQDN